MAKSVRFANDLEGLPNSVFNNGRGILRKCHNPSSDGSGHIVTRVYNGGTKVTSLNLFRIYKELVSVMQNGSYGSNDPPDSVPSQDFEFPTCLEVYTVLNIVLHVQLDVKTSNAPPVHPNQLIIWAKRDILQYKKSTDILNIRVPIQILRVVDYLFLADSARQSIQIDLAKFFIEEALQGIATRSNSKAMLATCLHIFGHIHLPKLMDKNVAIKLLQSMHKRALDLRLSAVSLEYITTFKTLLKHHREVMVQNTPLWVGTLVDALFEQSSLIRTSAYQLLLDLSRQKLTQVSSTIYQHLNESVELSPDTSISRVESATARMIKLLESPDEAKQTMAVWSCLLLFIGCNGSIKLETWKHLGTWLEVPRNGFNSPSLTIKDATFNAWQNVLYLFLFRYDNNTSVSRNLTSLLNPIKPKKQMSQPIFEQFRRCFDICLFMALRTCDHTEKHWNTTYDFLIQPCVEAMLSHPSDQIKQVACQYISNLLSLPCGTKTARTRLLDGKPVTAQEIGGLPKPWMRANVGKLTDLLHTVYVNAGSDHVCKYWDSIVAIIRQGSAADDDAVYEQLLICVNFLKQHYDQFSQVENDQLFTTFVCSFNYGLLVAQRFVLDEATGTFKVGAGRTSCATLLLSQAIQLDHLIFDRMLGRFSTVPSRQVAIIAKTIMSDPQDLHMWTSGVKHITRLLAKVDFGYFEGDDINEVLAVLEECAPSNPEYWNNLFTLTFNQANYPDIFAHFLKKLCTIDGYFDRVLDFKKSVFIDVADFDQFILDTCLAECPERLDHLHGFPSSFKVFVARYLYETYDASNMERAITLMGRDQLKANADIFLDALCTHQKRRVMKHWQTLFCTSTPLEGNFSPETVKRIEEMHSTGELSAVPEEITPLTPKRSLDAMSPPPTSPSLSSTPSKRQKKTVGSVGEGFTLSPPVSSVHEFEPETVDLCSSPPQQLRKNVDVIALQRALDAPSLGTAIKGMQRQQMIELKSRLQQTIDFLSIQINRTS